MKISFVFPSEVISGLTIRKSDDILSHLGALVERVLINAGFNIQKFYSLMAEYQAADVDLVYPLMLWPKTTLGDAFSRMLEKNLIDGRLVHVNVTKANIPQRPDLYDYIVIVRE